MASNSDLKSNSPGSGTSFDRREVLKSLAALRDFRANWDGYGAAPLDPKNLDAAQRFIESLPDDAAPTPMVVPMTRGRVQLEWHRGNRSLELEFATPTAVHYLKWDSDQGVEIEDVVAIDRVDVLASLLDWFIEE